jgi:hypothetical protein
MIWWISIGIGVLLILALAVYFRPRGPKLSATSKALIQRQWAHAVSLDDPTRKILEADKVLDTLLKELGYTGSLGDKLKKGGKYLPNLNDVWRAHKLRNTVAHEAGVSLSPRDSAAAMQAFETAIRHFL